MDVFFEGWGLWGLFFSAFISSTILPGGSEVLLIALASKSDHSSLSLLLAATLGNTLGGMSSWLLGRIIAWRFPADKFNQVERRRAVGQLQRWGSPILLLSWLPVIGDPLCVAAGWLRVKPWLAMLFIALGKGGRYAVLLLLVS